MSKTINIRGEKVLVDNDVYEWAKDMSWHILFKGTNIKLKYVVSGKGELMHRLILGLKKGQGMTDHINHNGLDNRRENLRFCTNAQNMHNRRTTKNYKGVYYIKKWDNWGSQCFFNNKKHYLGVYPTEEDAAKAYDSFAIENFGEFAELNFPYLQSLDKGDGGIKSDGLKPEDFKRALEGARYEGHRPDPEFPFKSDDTPDRGLKWEGTIGGDPNNPFPLKDKE